MIQTKPNDSDKIEFDSLIAEFRIQKVTIFENYLKEIWKDLSHQCSSKGISKIIFAKYYELPGIICDRLFSVLDRDNSGFLELGEFLSGMITLFTESYDKLAYFIFCFYDFDKDGVISKEDVRTVLSYVPLNINEKVHSESKLAYEKETFTDRIESQEELYKLLTKSFGSQMYLTFSKFLCAIETAGSEIFLFILIFLYERRPFTKNTLAYYEKGKKFDFKWNNYNLTHNNNNNSNHPENLRILNGIQNKLIVSPNLFSKFSPCITISKSPMLKKKDEVNINNTKQSKTASKSILMQYAQKRTSSNGNDDTSTSASSSQPSSLENFFHSIPHARGNRYRNTLKNIEIKKYSTLPYTAAFEEESASEILPAVKYQTERKVIDIGDVTKLFSEVTVSEGDISVSDIESKEEEVIQEGYLFKVTQSHKINKFFFKLVHKDLYYYKTMDDKSYKGMHHLSGVFVKEDGVKFLDGAQYYCFSVIYPKKIRYYYTDNQEDYHTWVNMIKKVTGYQNLTDIFELQHKIGSGKFGLVKLGVHRKTQRKVAIKVMSKRNMDMQDLEQVKIEIEILKICQHPNIIRLYDIFENADYIYIIMEYCGGGDLFSYFEKRGFAIPEPRACQLIHKLCTAVYYLHSYGIAHRDLKPENILMTDSTDESDLRLVDFGLSKIIGPNELCSEPFGTLSYVAPEVLIERPYTKAVDLWSIGIIAYLLLCGCLPFDHETSDREIARQTIQDPTPFPSYLWKKVSLEGKSLVDNLLQKDYTKRMDIKQVLEDPWFHKLIQTPMPEKRKNSKEIKESAFMLYSSVDA